MVPVKVMLVAVILVLLSVPKEGCSQMTGDLRLGGYGSTRYGGRIEMFVGGQWYAICNDVFDFRDANVVCRQLGLGYVVNLVNTDRESTGGRDPVFNRYGVEPNIIIGRVSCRGNESHILNCVYATQHGCGRHEAIGVECSDYREQPYNGEVRLVGGEYPSEGRLEVFFNGQWGGVCSSGFDQSDGDVVCRQLGYTHSEEVSTSNVDGYVSTSTRVWLTNVACPVSTTQREFCLKSCLPSQSAPSASSSIQCSSGLVGLVCGFNTSVRDPSSSGSKELCEVVKGSVPANGELRIVDGPARNLGRVEVYLNGVWGTVCGAKTQHSRPSAEVICRQLGYKTWSNVYYRSVVEGYGSGDGPRHITRLNCSGGENTVLDCRRENATISPCGLADIMAIRCNTNLQLSPFGGMTLFDGSGGHGHLLINQAGRFAPICDHTFGEKEGDVACRQMGYARAIGVVRNSYYAIGQLPSGLSHIRCHGNETHLLQCDHRNDSKNHCDKYDQVGLQCSTDNDHREGGLRLVGGNSSAGVVELFLNGKWNRICSVNFKLTDAHVACRQLGFSGATRFFNDGRYGSLNNGIFAMLGCYGSEESLFNCSHTPLEPLYCGRDIAVSCSLEPVCEEGSVRLTGGASNITGRLEVCEYGRWGSVCSYAFDHKDALVACKHLGFREEERFIESGRIVPGDIPINIFASHCHGNEAKLTSCEHEVSTRRCNHSLDVVLTCRECTLECLNAGIFDTETCTCDCTLTDYTGKACNVCAIERNCENGATPNSQDCTCECPRGYSGKYCQICSIADECQNNSTAIEENCRCECTKDYTGHFCEDCDIECENGGTADLGTCSCTCPLGYSGKYCQNCSLKCLNGGVLNNETCTCDCALTDYTGDRCEMCDLKCVNGGLDDDNCKCICYEGFTGKICNAYVCDPACVRGTCTEDMVCACPEGWIGEDCNTPIACGPEFNVTPSVTYDASNQTLNIVHYPPEGSACKCVFRKMEKKEPCLPRDTMSGVRLRKNEKGRLVITCIAGGSSSKLSMQVKNE